MPGIVIEESIGCTNPLLQFANQINGILTDVAELSFKVTEVRNGGEKVPETPVNLALCSEGGAKLGTGRYAATFQPTAPDWLTGTHEILWTYKTDASDPAKLYAQRFEVLEPGVVAAGSGYVGYVNSIDLTENSAFSCYKLKSIQKVIIEVSRQIQYLTGRFFDPTFISAKLNGTDAGALVIGDPIIGISKLAIISGGPADEVLDLDLEYMRIYNRHIVGLINPDDRDNPRIEFSTDLLPGKIVAQGRFHRGRQNTLVEGMFGYTEPDGSPMGTLPARLQKAAGLMSLRLLQDPFGTDVFISNPGRIREAKTRDQQVKFGGVSDGGVGNLTGDRILDDILTEYLRPPQYGAIAPGGRNYDYGTTESF
jgi:hypothetical protein